MDKLDDMVVSHIEDRLLDPARLEKLLGSILGRREDQAERRREHIAFLQRQATESESRLKRLYDAIEAGVADLGDPALKERIAGLKVIRDQARTDADRARALLESPGHSALSPAMIEGSHAARGSGFIAARAAIGGIICAPRRSASRLQTMQSASWDRKRSCSGRRLLLKGNNPRRLACPEAD
ncbi:hypothetical protein [Xanthobacter sp. ZOL 2024]